MGLKPEISKQFVANEEENLQELLQHARRLESILKKENETHLEEAAKSMEAAILNKYTIKCFKCGQLGHFANKCSNYKKEDKFNQSDSKITCMFCGKNNHLAINCQIIKVF